MTTDKKIQKNTFKDDVLTYFKGVKTEWSKVSWPTKKQVLLECGVVVVVVTIFTFVVFVMDKIFQALLGLIK